MRNKIFGGALIYPRCKKDQDQIYVSSEGHCLPCCWIGNQPYLDEYREFLGSDLFSSLDLEKNELHDLLTGPAQAKLESSWTSSMPFRACAVFCSKDLSDEESQKLQGTNERLRLSLKSSEPKS